MKSIKLTALTAPNIQRLYNDSLKDHTVKIQQPGEKIRTEKRKAVSAKTVHNLHCILHKMLKQAVLLQYIRANPCDSVQLPRVEKFNIQPITDEYIAPFLKAIEQSKYRDLFFVDVFSGLRQGELLGFTWDCVNFKQGTITVNKQLQHRRYSNDVWELLPTKTDKERVVTPAPEVMMVFRKIQQQQKENKLKSGGVWENEMNLVFTNETGKHLHPNTIRVNLKKICTSIGLDNTRFHDLRHTFASLSIQNGDSLKTVADQLGHSTITTTANIYAHVTDQMRKESANRMQMLIDKAR